MVGFLVGRGFWGLGFGIWGSVVMERVYGQANNPQLFPQTFFWFLCLIERFK